MGFFVGGGGVVFFKFKKFLIFTSIYINIIKNNLQKWIIRHIGINWYY